jgi:hypothetical protein
MTDATTHDRHAQAADYLGSMRALGHDLERAMQAIAENSLADLEESVSNQQVLSVRLNNLVEGLSSEVADGTQISTVLLRGDLGYQIRAASEVLQNLNQCYAALLRHSNRCTGQMASLFHALQGQEAAGSGSKYQTWSCQM